MSSFDQLVHCELNRIWLPYNFQVRLYLTIEEHPRGTIQVDFLSVKHCVFLKKKIEECEFIKQMALWALI